MGVTAFMFEVTRPKLLQLGWFRWLYEHVLVWLDWAHEMVDPIRRRVRRSLRIFRPQQAGRALRLLCRIRRRMRAARRDAMLAGSDTNARRAARTGRSP